MSSVLHLRHAKIQLVLAVCMQRCGVLDAQEQGALSGMTLKTRRMSQGGMNTLHASKGCKQICTFVVGRVYQESTRKLGSGS